jgi:D-glycero-D-manno-heptose 1,7-bisphosphate phosphatase
MSISPEQTLYMMVGFPASGKTTIAKTYDLPILSRDVEGGSCAALLPKLEALFKEGKSVVLDNTNLTKEARAPFISLAKKHGIQVHAVYIENTIEDCQVNALVRMWQTRGRLYLSAGGGNPLPISALFVARKNFEKPTVAEGFDRIIKPLPYNACFIGSKALFLDIDGTIRRSEHLPYKYPTNPEEVELIRPATTLRQTIDAYRSQGYRIIGVSNQSGIAKGTLTEADAEACFERTRSLLGYTAEEFPIMYCPHRSAPITCYCRKPQSGLFVKAALEYGLDIATSIMVGDLKTDETAAQRLGMRFIHASDFV